MTLSKCGTCNGTALEKALRTGLQMLKNTVDFRQEVAAEINGGKTQPITKSLH
jgi:hypothetical protein